ncbi:uncharacterized protein B0H18DRAFT_1126281 [Fomitopsis serialis]|uniref:uncharacterized protein n=1 Tax=Fomitopsis serialis TaxID=139415 RepID=UPI002007C979|nr:uncharacterized protein B0H18DRAFT_1126281 [Neoantrodia serialis]KAH9913418.1 hypothetical protein B0H18DRAFT_1126281 [Neoantrodia serialis]
MSKSLPLHLSDRIPLEVFEDIVDYMPISTLLDAVLVCRAWHSRASRRLYSTVVIKSRTQYDLLVEQSRTSPRVKQWLTTTRDLIVLCSYNSKREGITFLNSLPLVFAHTLPALRVLDIRRMLCYNMHPTFYHALRCFTHIMSLRLDDAVLGNVAQLRRIVCAFPHLEDLALDRVTFRQPRYVSSRPPYWTDTPLRPQSNTRLKVLTISAHPNAGSDSFISQANWLVTSALCVSLRNLVVRFLCKDDPYLKLACEQVDRLLGASGTSLTSFHRIYDFWHGYPPARFSLIHNTALRTLKLDLNIHLNRPDANWRAVATELHATLSTVRSSQIEHITIDTMIYFTLGRLPADREDCIPSCGELEADLRSMHDVMVTPYFDGLKDVGVKVKIWHDRRRSADWADDIARATVPVFCQFLRPWHKRGLVDISYTTWGGLTTIGSWP